MKIRIGFVSNSSSSSFAVYGLQGSESNMVTLLKNAGIKVPKKYEKDEYDNYWDENPRYDWVQMNLSNLLKDSTLEWGGGGEDAYYYVGRPLKSIKDDETGLEFKRAVELEFKRVFNQPVELDYEYGEISC